MVFSPISKQRRKPFKHFAQWYPDLWGKTGNIEWANSGGHIQKSFFNYSFLNKLFSACPGSFDHLGPQRNLRAIELIHALGRRAHNFSAQAGNALFDVG